MSGVSPRLRCLFFSFNVVFVVGGGLLVLTAVSGLSPSEDTLHGGGHEDTTVHMVLYVYGSVTMAISILGAFGAHRLNLTALVVCLLCTVTTGLLTLRDGITAATARPQLQRRMELSWRLLLPLDGASDDRKQRVETLQTSLRCCGLFGHEDWEDHVPDSCLCSRGEDECQEVDYRNFLSNLLWQKKWVHKQSCFPLVLRDVKTNSDVTLAVSFTLSFLALLGALLSSLMIYQTFNRPLAVFPEQPPSYQQLYNLPE
ncbi:23 kDa integral membrane protein-like isoform X2 [Mugil cephalus]|uniref:23 kDa integral membrane protein-like isoform X2 n=1 Tax=Mugil cephalus TaxID=48193 RepID=UPI001FB58CEE|nr:23 kDa integral membrane protein-like isoform X2 [Mugil cephalus]XP_047431016.1 23 kDa integral membrane protein-like isoform X2 [Mugil cephalus]